MCATRQKANFSLCTPQNDGRFHEHFVLLECNKLISNHAHWNGNSLLQVSEQRWLDGDVAGLLTQRSGVATPQRDVLVLVSVVHV